MLHVFFQIPPAHAPATSVRQPVGRNSGSAPLLGSFRSRDGATFKPSYARGERTSTSGTAFGKVLLIGTVIHVWGGLDVVVVDCRTLIIISRRMNTAGIVLMECGPRKLIVSPCARGVA